MSDKQTHSEHDYDALKRAVEAEGFFTTFQPITAPGDRIVCASNQFEHGLDGVSFWIAKRGTGWFIATWLPRIYRIPEGSEIEALAVEALRAGGGTPYDFSESLKFKWRLTEVTDEEFDHA